MPTAGHARPRRRHHHRGLPPRPKSPHLFSPQNPCEAARGAPGFDLEAVDDLGHTALTTAVRHRRPDIVRTLAAAGGRVPPGVLYPAVSAGDIPTVQALLEVGSH